MSTSLSLQTSATLCVSQKFFKEANETYSNLQKEHEMVRKKFTCDKNTSLDDLLELLRGLEVRQLPISCALFTVLKLSKDPSTDLEPLILNICCHLGQKFF